MNYSEYVRMSEGQGMACMTKTELRSLVIEHERLECMLDNYKIDAQIYKAENESLRKTLIDVREALGREYWDQYAGLDETRDILDAAISSPENPS